MKDIHEYRVLLHNIADFEGNSTKGNKPKCFVYFLCDGEFVKIGIADDIVLRAKQIQTSNARKIELLAYKKYKTRASAMYAEKAFHEFWQEQRLNGEWFDIADNEWFITLMQSDNVLKGTFKSPQSEAEIRCIAIEEYGEDCKNNVVDLTEAIEKMKAFYREDRTVLSHA